MPTYRLDFAYDGSSFFGYAVQKDVRTVQGELEKALRPHIGNVSTHVAGRTDKGVHASMQVASFESAEIDTDHVVRSLNKQLHPEIAAIALTRVDDGFHARFSATGRAYRYVILNRELHDPLTANSTWHVKVSLDLGSMNDAASHLVGEHDFASLCRRYRDRSTIRAVEWAAWRRIDDELELSIGARAFCHQMVRSIAALCVAVGSGEIGVDAVPDILSAGDRSLTKGVAPAHALTLVTVAYFGEPLSRPGWVSVPA